MLGALDNLAIASQPNEDAIARRGQDPTANPPLPQLAEHGFETEWLGQGLE